MTVQPHLLTAVLLVVSVQVEAQSSPLRSPPTDPRTDILAAERSLETALIKMDRGALDRLYADDLESRHWSGARDTKASWLRFIVDSITYKRHSPQIDRMEVYPNAVWASGTMISVAKLLGTSKFEAESLLFGHLWVKDGNRWRLREQAGRKLEHSPRKP
jgi:Domain of unknown function (DUF4440)